MGSARTTTAVLHGVEALPVHVEVDIAQGVVGTAVVGLPDRGVTEAKERVRAAMQNSQEAWPASRITISLAPAGLPKAGAVIDLAIAVAMLAAQGRVPRRLVESAMVLGEVGLDGSVKPVRGVLPAVMAARRDGCERVVVPAACAAEAALVAGIDVVAVRSVAHAVAVLRGEAAADEAPAPIIGASTGSSRSWPGRGKDLADVVGQPLARRALEIAAVGGHHLLLLGPPGVGKTMLAERLVGLLPALTGDAALEATAVHSVAGTLEPAAPLVDTPPFEAPHHTASFVALVGGGSGRPQPGAVSRAHHGVLFLDEAPHFAPSVLDALRQPLESGTVTVARGGFRTTFPAAFQLVLAANPCPCGRGDLRGIGCRCTPMQRRRYAERLSGPLVDRIDLAVTTQSVDEAALLAHGMRGESTAEVRERVLAAAARMQARLAGTEYDCNARVPGAALKRAGALGVAPSALEWLQGAVRRGRLSARAIDKVLRVAWSVADLAGAERPGLTEVAEAVGLRDDSFTVAA